MNGQTHESVSQALSSQYHLELLVKLAAEHFSVIRRINILFWEHQKRLEHIRDMPSTHEEMLHDWREGCAFVSLKIIEGEIDFAQIEPTCFQLLEGAWLKRVKQLKAYYIWEHEDTGDHEQNYFRASDGIRKLLLERKRAPIQDFENVKTYLEKTYLTDGNNEKFDDAKPTAITLINAKTTRICETKGGDWNTNWCRAKLYITMFYENIIGAVVDNDKQKTLSILKAFEFSKSQANRYLIINAFETAIAISFLNKDIIHQVLESPELYNFSMEPVEDWPDEVAMPQSLKYNRGDKQLIYEGVMRDTEKEALLKLLTNKKHRVAVECLYEQSHLSPYKELIL